jgi:hypothetical protein
MAAATFAAGGTNTLFAPPAGAVWMQNTSPQTPTNQNTTATNQNTTATNQNAGSNTPHNTMPPFLVITYIIKVSPTGGATAQAPIADATQAGLMKRLSGLATDYVGGDNACHPRNAAIVGNVTGDTIGPGAIAVPAYANHPDAIWSPMGALDDHFDAGSIDPKWTIGISSGTANPVTEQAGSHLSLGGCSPNATDGLFYNVNASVLLPNANSFTLTAKARVIAMANYGQAGSWAFAWFRIQTSGTTGAEWRFGKNAANIATSPVVNTVNTALWGYAGTNFATLTLNMGITDQPQYWRMVYDSAAKSTNLWISDNGVSWFLIQSIVGTTSGFSTAPPYRAYLGFTGVNLARGIVHFDWIRFTNP